MDAKPYYSFNWGAAHFTVINSELANVSASQPERDAFWQEQTRWLEADLQDAQKSDFRFVFAHHPPMTAVKRRQGDNPHMTALEPIFEKYGVAAAFFGHDHNYQHLRRDVHYSSRVEAAHLYDVDMPPEDIKIKVASMKICSSKRRWEKAHIEAEAQRGYGGHHRPGSQSW
jgi:hypothetical protein